MMKAIKNFMNKPFTWGGYLKLCLAGFAGALAYCGWIWYKLGLLNQWFGKKEESNLEENEI